MPRFYAKSSVMLSVSSAMRFGLMRPFLITLFTLNRVKQNRIDVILYPHGRVFPLKNKDNI